MRFCIGRQDITQYCIIKRGRIPPLFLEFAFEAAGLIERHNFDNGPAVYELDRGEHHDHMICTETGAVIEFHDAEIEKIQERIASQNGYQLVGHSLVLYVKPKD